MSAVAAQIPTPSGASMPEVVKTVRESMHLIFAQEPSGIIRCEREGEGWVIDLEMVESKARMDNNDLLSAYRVQADAYGEVQSYAFQGRYFRMDRAKAVS